jgi:hypothetical protein
MRELDLPPLLDSSPSVNDAKEAGTINKQIPITPTPKNFEYLLADINTYLFRHDAPGIRS